MKVDFRSPALAVSILLAHPSMAAAGESATSGQAAGFFLGLALGCLICLVLGTWALWRQRAMLVAFAGKLSRLAANEPVPPFATAKVDGPWRQILTAAEALRQSPAPVTIAAPIALTPDESLADLAATIEAETTAALEDLDRRVAMLRRNSAAMTEAAEDGARAAGATILHSHYHHFGEESGVSGVTVLAESHITIHTWPEVGYAAIDVFMCGDAKPMDCLALLEKRFNPTTVSTENVRRGRLLREVRAQRVA